QTSATFTAQPGHSYAFYSVATDNLGHVQPTPATGQATTSVPAEKNSQYVVSVYVDLLKRPVDASGLAYWTGRLDNNQPRDIIAALLTHSAEYFQTNIIKPAYRQFLNRDSEQDGLDYWT